MSIDALKKAARNGYARGYQTGLRRMWADHLPLYPPNKVIAELMEAGEEIRQAAEIWESVFGPEDDLTKDMTPAIDRWHAAMHAYKTWLIESAAAKEET
jgi:hypothetical protein